MRMDDRVVYALGMLRDQLILLPVRYVVVFFTLVVITNPLIPILLLTFGCVVAAFAMLYHSQAMNLILKSLL